MDLEFLFLVSWFPVLVHLMLAGWVYVDAPNYDLSPRKWAAISLLIPFFGFFAYIFERGERTPGPDRDMFEDRGFEIHESRADEIGIEKGGSPESVTAESGDATDQRVAESDAQEEEQDG